MDATASWSVRCEIEGQTLAPTVAYETALTEICGAHVVSVSRPYLDAPTWIIEGFFDTAPDAGLVKQALTLASESEDVPSYDIIDHGVRDWLAENRASFPALHIGRFWVYGAHITDAAPAGAKKLHVEAAEAFGSGTHPTTEGCLRALDDVLAKRPARRVLDLGAGSAILAMAVSRLAPSATIVASDIDPVATRTALANRRLNHIAPQSLSCVTSKGFAHRMVRQAAPYDLLIANILAGPLKELAPDITAHLSDDGVLILSGILISQERQIRAAYRRCGLVVRRAIHIDEWTCLVFTKMQHRGAV